MCAVMAAAAAVSNEGGSGGIWSCDACASIVNESCTSEAIHRNVSALIVLCSSVKLEKEKMKKKKKKQCIII